MSIRRKIVDYINSDAYKPMLKEELLVKFGIDKKESKEFYNILTSLEKEGLIIKSTNNRYGSINSEFLVVGKLEGHEKGFGFVSADDTEREDVFISVQNMNGAMHGDRVIANIIKKSEVGRREEGEIIRILDRGNRRIVGTFEMSKNFGFVIPDDTKISSDIFISKNNIRGAKDRQKVVVDIVKWPESRRNPEGKVVEVLGYPEDKGTDVLSIIRQFDLPEKFPKEVKDYAKSIEQKISKSDLEGRTDLRSLNTFTIDGADAKDLDDAISIKKLNDNSYELGVHIADVAHYVTKGTLLDKEAYERGNSVYLIDRVVPMLPKELSNGICSLNKNEDRLTMSVIMEINNKGDVVKHRIEETIINSKAKLVYDDVSDYLEDKTIEPDNSIVELLYEIKLMEELMEILQEKRKRRGSIDFDFPETKIVLNENGYPIDIDEEKRRVGHRIIEEFMIVTNETVAEEYYWSEIPYLYRVHEDPSEEKIEEFAKLIHNFGYNMKGKDIHPKEFQLLTEEIKGKSEERVISTMLLRSLRKAKYSSIGDSHFGLASKHYSHFTAPIRRYSDLVIHRIIKQNLRGKLDLNTHEQLEDQLPDIAKHVSMTERRAEEAEREVEDLKKTQFMTDKVGKEFYGIISSLTNFGMFVQLKNTIEGLVHFSNMTDDYYYFDEENYYMIGERTKNIYRLGDKVKIRVIDADIVKRTIDFELIEKEGQEV